jgi:hypothetical protein
MTLVAGLVTKPEPQQQHDDRADDRPDDAGWLDESAVRVVVEEKASGLEAAPSTAQEAGYREGERGEDRTTADG